MTSGVYIRKPNRKKRVANIEKACLICEKPFITAWNKKIYCSRECYMSGVSSRSRKWDKTLAGIEYRKEYNLRSPRFIRIKALVTLGGKCVKCGFTDYRALQIDHIEGGGHKEILKHRKQMYGRIARGEHDKTKYQLLCANCNWIKRYEKNEAGIRSDYNQLLIEASIRGNGEHINAT